MDIDARTAARLLGMTEDEVFRLAEADELPHHLVQDQPRFNRVDLLEYATRRRLRVAADLFEDAQACLDGRRVRLSALLLEGGVHRGVQGSSPGQVLGALSRAIPALEGVDRAALAARVEAGARLTPIGRGLAIPHSRAPVAVAPHRPLLALGLPAVPLACSTPDGQPVRALFFIVSPSVRVHLDVLSKLGTALLDPLFVDLVSSGAPDAELLGRLRAVEAAPAPSGESPPQ